MEKFILLSCFLEIWTVYAQANTTPSNNMILSGDLLLTKRQHDILSGRRTLEKDETLVIKWDKNEEGMVVIPYTFDPNAGYAKNETEFIVNDLKQVEKGTCIRFIPRTDEIDYIEVVDDYGCYSSLGRSGGMQTISMSRTFCLHKGYMAHEAIHALGFNHMQKAFDRDEYITVLYENIQPGTFIQFDKVDEKLFNYFGTSYDLRSIMHYPRNALSSNGKDTIVPHDLSYIDIIGQIGELSEGDLIRINTMYECK